MPLQRKRERLLLRSSYLLLADLRALRIRLIYLELRLLLEMCGIQPSGDMTWTSRARKLVLLAMGVLRESHSTFAHRKSDDRAAPLQRSIRPRNNRGSQRLGCQFLPNTLVVRAEGKQASR